MNIPDEGFFTLLTQGMRNRTVETLQRALYHTLRDAILQGTLTARCRLPGSRVMAERLHLSRNTVNAALEQLATRLGMAPPPAGAVQYVGRAGGMTVRWSLHTEFVRYTFGIEGSGGEPFVQNALTGIPDDWLASVPGRMLAGVHALVVGEAEAPSLNDMARGWFAGHDLIGAGIADGAATALTDLRLHDDAYAGCGFVRYVVLNRQLNPRQMGRMLGRLFEIECYRMLALLALPVAKQQMRELDEVSLRLSSATRELLAPTAGGDLLAELTCLAGRLEDAVSTSQYRFSAARAYYQLVERRIGELREVRLAGLQPFREFMERRLAPAMQTCDTVMGRQERLSARLQRATALMRTRIEVELQQQNRELLQSMDRRAALQLRLQETVEGLSVGVLTYYAVGLFGYVAKALKVLGVPLNAELATGLAIVPIGGAVWWGVQRAKRHLGHG